MTDESIRDYTRAELLALTPARYLKDGFVDDKGKPRPGLQTGYATAAATQLLAAELSPQELAFTYEALRQSLAMQDGAAPKRIRAAVDEALEMVRGMIRQPNNPGLTKWINECAALVKRPSCRYLKRQLIHHRKVHPLSAGKSIFPLPCWSRVKGRFFVLQKDFCKIGGFAAYYKVMIENV